MRKLSIAVLLISLIVISCEQITEPDILNNDVESVENGTPIEGRYIVVYEDAEISSLGKPALVESITQDIFAKNNIAPEAMERVYAHAIRGVSARLSETEAERISRDPRVKYVEQDRVIVLGKPSWLGGDSGADQVTPWGITRVGGGISSSSVTAWIIDTGIDLDHPDLNVDASRSISFITTGQDADNPDDLNGHGSHVSGTVGAIDNDIDVIGVAPGITLVAVKVLDRRGSGSYSGVIAGVDHVAANAGNGDVANMSLGGPASDALDDAVIAAAESGVKFALAAGNDSDDANLYSPARANHSNIYTVSSFAEGDVWSSFSNWGNPPIEFSAPGSSILSTYKDGGTATLSGTSMASPHVCGLLALGSVSSDGFVTGDPDGNPDPIAHN